MFRLPVRPIDRLYRGLILGQKRPVIGPVLRQLLKLRGIDIPAEALQPGDGLVLRHAGNVVVHRQSRIGRNVMLHQGVTVGRGDIWRDQDPSFKGFVIEDEVILGANAVVVSQKGLLTIAEGTVLGANSVLNKSTGPWEIWAGAPARKVGERERP